MILGMCFTGCDLILYGRFINQLCVIRLLPCPCGNLWTIPPYLNLYALTVSHQRQAVLFYSDIFLILFRKYLCYHIHCRFHRQAQSHAMQQFGNTTKLRIPLF